MKKYALINLENKVVNIIVWDGTSLYTPPENNQMIELSDGAYVGIGFTYDGTNFIAPEVV